MSTHIALLRAANVAGHNTIAMAELRRMFDGLGLAEATTLLQSGNVVFRGGHKSDETIERLLEAETTKRFKLTIDYLVRSARELHTTITRNPFPREAADDPGHLLVMFLKQAPAAKDVKALAAAIRGPEVLRAIGRELYIVYPDGIGRSKLAGTFIEQKLATRGTGRNWNTVLKLAEQAKA